MVVSIAGEKGRRGMGHAAPSGLCHVLFFWSERQPNSIDHAYFYLMGVAICVHILSDLGDLNNLIGSLSRTIQQYSPPSEWIMC